MYLFKIYLIIILGNIYIWDIGKEAVETASLQAGLCCLVYVSHGAGGDQRPWATCSILCKILKPQEEPSLKLWNLGLWHQMTTCSYLIAWFFSNLCLHSNWLIGVSDSIWGQEWLRVYFFVFLCYFVFLCCRQGLKVSKSLQPLEWVDIQKRKETIRLAVHSSCCLFICEVLPVCSCETRLVLLCVPFSHVQQWQYAHLLLQEEQICLHSRLLKKILLYFGNLYIVDSGTADQELQESV